MSTNETIPTSPTSVTKEEDSSKDSEHVEGVGGGEEEGGGEGGKEEAGKGGEKEEAPELHSNTVKLENMKNQVFFLYPDRNVRLSGFWLLMILSSIIATSGVGSDSAATVIGAMIVAPLMTPILGTMLSIVIGDGRNFLVSLTLVLTGAGSAILIGYLYGLALNDDWISKENNSQVAGRVQPKLTDLIGALATGAVGSIALVRKDIASTMPGVAISIALVPPLCVVGLTLSSNEGQDAAGAMLLFATNFACIVVMGIIVMHLYRVPRMVTDITRRKRVAQIIAVLVNLGLLAMVAIPLTITSKQLSDTYAITDCLTAKINEWGNPNGWYVNLIVTTGKLGEYIAQVTIAGEPPFPEDSDFPNVTNICDADSIDLRFIPAKTYEVY
jgi:uncharacterized hydrophobic protein (TIGR00271 family)